MVIAGCMLHVDVVILLEIRTSSREFGLTINACYSNTESFIIDKHKLES